MPSIAAAPSPAPEPSPGPAPSTAGATPTAAGSAGLGPYAGLAVVLVLWGLGPPLSKLITAPPLTASFARLWTSAVAIVALQWVRGSRPSWPTLRSGLIGGVAFGLNSLCFFFALANASIATITVIGALQPVLVMFGASQLFGERITRWGLAWTGVAIGGATMAVLGAGAAVHTTALGVACAVGSLLCMGVYFLAAKSARSVLSAGDYVMGVMLWASLLVTPVVALGGGLGHLDQFDRVDLMWLAVMLVGPGIGGQLLMGWAVRYVAVSRSALILLGSTAVSIVAAWPIHGEQPSLLQLAGGGLALAAVAAILSRG